MGVEEEDRDGEQTEVHRPLWLKQDDATEIFEATQILDFRGSPDRPASTISQADRQSALEPDEVRRRLSPLDRRITRLGNFRLVKLLGEGGFSWVYLARQIFDEGSGQDAAEDRIERDVAVKVLKRMGTAEQFKAEVDTLATLGSHPNIIGIHDGRTTVGVDPDGYWYEFAWLAMPFAKGGTLKEWLRAFHDQGKMPPLDQVALVMEQISSALDYAHQQGRIHRDIKPANILFDAYNRPLLSDFGIALTSSGVGRSSTYEQAFTPSYMAPEQVPLEADTPPRSDPRSDIYSLGVVLFETLTGELPFKADSVISLQYQIVTQEPPSARERNRRLPRPVDRVVQKTMAKDPGERYQTATAMAKALRSATKFNRRLLMALSVTAAVLLVACIVVIAVARAATVQQSEQTKAQATQAVLEAAAADSQVAARATQVALEERDTTRQAEFRASQTAEAQAAAVVAAETAAAAGAATRVVADVTATYQAQPTPPPGAYLLGQEGHAEPLEDFSTDGILLRRAIPTMRVDQAEVLDDGTIKIYVSQWVDYPVIHQRVLAGYALVKNSDRDKSSIYLADQQGRRYAYFDVGDDVGREVVMEEGVVASGWFHFPAPEPGGTIFDLFVVDEGYVIRDLDLSGQ